MTFFKENDLDKTSDTYYFDFFSSKIVRTHPKSEKNKNNLCSSRFKYE